MIKDKQTKEYESRLFEDDSVQLHDEIRAKIDELFVLLKQSSSYKSKKLKRFLSAMSFRGNLTNGTR